MEPNPFRMVADDDDRYPVPGTSSYSPHEFYTRGSDRRGHNKEYRVTVSADWPPIIAKVVEAIPEYQTFASFLRDAIFHRAHYLLEHLDDASLRAEIENAIVMQREREDTERTANWENFLDECEERLEKLVRSKDRGGLARLTRTLEEFACTVPDPYDTQANDLADIARRRTLRLAR